MLGHKCLNIFSFSLIQRRSLGSLFHHKVRKGHKGPEVLVFDTVTGPFGIPSFASFVSFVVGIIIKTIVRLFHIRRSLQPSKSGWPDGTSVASRNPLSLATIHRGLSSPL